MKKVVNMTVVLAALSFTMMSCQKEYSCVCANYNEIVSANSQADAENTCDAKGPDCDIQ